MFTNVYMYVHIRINTYRRYENTDVLQSYDKHPTNQVAKTCLLIHVCKSAYIFINVSMYQLLVELDSTSLWSRTKEKALRCRGALGIASELL